MQSQSEDQRAKLASLSKREFETFDLVIRGMTTKEISTALGISVRTAEHHRRHLYEKLSANNVVEVVRIAVFSGYLTSDIGTV